MFDTTLIDDFQNQPELRWEFCDDRYLGGHSIGQMEFLTEGPSSFGRLSGEVRKTKEASFIEMTRSFDERTTVDFHGIYLTVRGIPRRYFVHLWGKSALSSEYYQAKFEVPFAHDWRTVTIPFKQFKSNGPLLRNPPHAPALRAIGIVASGSKHTARIDVLEMGFC